MYTARPQETKTNGQSSPAGPFLCDSQADSEGSIPFAAPVANGAALARCLTIRHSRWMANHGTSRAVVAASRVPLAIGERPPLLVARPAEAATSCERLPAVVAVHLVTRVIRWAEGITVGYLAHS